MSQSLRALWNVRVLALVALVVALIFVTSVVVQAQTVKFNVGDRVATTAKLNVRVTPNGRRVGSQNLGAQGTVVAGPQYVKGYYWYQINYDTGVDGWSVQDYLQSLSTPTPVPTTAPTVTFSASPSSVAPGGTSTLGWTSTNATSCTGSGAWSGIKATSGYQTFNSLQSNQTYTITCTGAGGSATMSVTVTVTTSTPTPAPTVTFSANPATVTSGGSVTLTWSSTNATSCAAAGGWTGLKSLSGSVVLSNLTASQNYILACAGAGGTTTQSVSVSVTSVTPTPTPVPPAPVGTYPVYQGCEAPATTFLRTIYVDPVNGSDTGDGSTAAPLKTLSGAFGGQKIKQGDHVVVLPGNHGDVYADTYGNNALSINPTPGKWVWLDFRPGAIVSSIEFRGMNRFLITGAVVTNPIGKTLIQLSDENNIVIADSNVYSVKDSSAWTATQWLGASAGINSDNGTCLSVLRNHLTNLSAGINIFTRSTSADPAQNSIKGLVDGNVLRNFVADGIHPNGSDMMVSNNVLLDQYLSPADGDDNHDDGIQVFAVGAAPYQNITIDHNWVQESTSPTRLFPSHAQGITHFDDGPVYNMRVTNNVVLTSGYHGISIYSGNNSIIDHNTVANIVPGIYDPWIYAAAPAANVTVSNNTDDSIWGATSGVTFTNNVTYTTPSTVFTTFDIVGNHYNLTPKAGSILAGTGAGVSSFPQPSTATGTVAGEAIANVITKLLARGATGAEVTALQNVLQKLGLLTSDSITGFYGPMTAQAVMNFQASKGLEATGTTGPRTRALLNALAASN
jgi:hypothetical protein